QSPLRLCEYFDDELWVELFAEFCELYPYASIPDKISNLFLNIIKILCKELNQTECQKLARCYLRNFEVIIEEEEIIIEMFKELVDNKQSSFTRNYIFVFRVLEKSLCDRSLVRRDLSHDINWRVRTSKGFYIVGYCLAVLLSPEYNL
ncbi:6008_t:CDS:2, partial [Rhizophagus irregularis]